MISKNQGGISYFNGVGIVNVVCSEQKRRRGAKTRKYIVSSNLSLTAREFISQYRKRWAIEKYHMLLKKYYGFEDCQSPCFKAVQTHVVICVLADIMQHHLNEWLPKFGTTVHEYE
ncbi:MAG: transposase [Oligoflexales bacterium]|nr:transposase [Oligoflexales bacterium]